MNPKFHPLLGDFIEMRNEYENKDRFIAHYFRDVAMKGFPHVYFNSGRFDQLWISDPKAMAEFSLLVPSHFDRKAIDNSGFGRIGGTGGVSQVPTGEQWKLRRTSFLKSIGLNYASRFLPIIIDECKRCFDKWEVG